MADEWEATGPASVLLIDDDPTALEFLRDALAATGHRIEAVSESARAATLIESKRFDVIVSDIAMPGLDGLELLRRVRQTDLDLPVVLVTGSPSAETAIRAMEFGAYRYLTKPVSVAELRRVVDYGITLYRMAWAKREALRMATGIDGIAGQRTALELTFERALATTWMAFQPIVNWSTKEVYGYEALARSDDPSLGSPLALIETAESLGRLVALGRHLRSLVAAAIPTLPPGANVFMNIHPRDLEDADLYDPQSPLAKSADRIVIELTERASLEASPDALARLMALKNLGYRIAIDDVGAGHAGLATFARIDPDVAKIDMGLVRGIDRDARKQKVIRAMTGLCKELKVLVIPEGVETAAERDALVEAGCELLQGYLFGRPQRTPGAATF